MGARSRRKGATWERDLAARLQGVAGWDTRRGIGQARSGGEVCDVEGTPWWIEAKVGKRPNLYAALAQADEATDGRAPVVIARINGFGGQPTQDVVVMRLADWIVLAEGSNAVRTRRQP